MSDSLDMSWAKDGNCSGLGPEVMNPPAKVGKGGRVGKDHDRVNDPRSLDDIQKNVRKRYCEDCPSKTPCLEYALATGQHYGVWGNTTEKERGQMIIDHGTSFYGSKVGQY